MSGFFGFDTDVPSLGAGKFDDLDAELPDDEDIDIVNDETFGAGAEFGGDWEEQHEKLAVELETFKFEGLGHQRHSSFDEDPLHSTVRDEDFLQADHYTAQEDDLEKSLSQLVVDDDEIDDPAIMNLSKNRPIPQVKNNNLDNLFGPSSPPAFLNTEHLVSPGKTNIWGSPATRESYIQPTPPKEDAGIKNLLSMLQGKSHQQAPFQDPSIVMAGKSTPLPNARSVDELEQELTAHPPNYQTHHSHTGLPHQTQQQPHKQQHQQQQLPPMPPQLANKGLGRSMTVEELEREMRGQPIPVPPDGRSPHQRMPIGTPPNGQYIQQHMQRMPMNNKAASGGMIGSPGQPFSSSPHAPGYSHSTAPITIAKRGTPPPPGFQQQASPCTSFLLSAFLRHTPSPQVPSPPPLMTAPSPSTSSAPSSWSLTPTAQNFFESMVRPQSPNVNGLLPLTPRSLTPPPMPSTNLQHQLGIPPQPRSVPLSSSAPRECYIPLATNRHPVPSPTTQVGECPTAKMTPGTLTPTEVKHRLAVALTHKIISSSIKGSPSDRPSQKNMPPFMGNNQGQQRMPYAGGFNDRGRGPHHQGPPPARGHMIFNQNKQVYDPRFPNDRYSNERFQNGRHPSGERFPPMDDRYGPGDRFANGDFHGRHPNDHHMERGGGGGRGFNHMDRGGRGFGGRGGAGPGGRGFDGPMEPFGRGGFEMRGRGGPHDMRGGGPGGRGGFDMRGRGRGFHHQGYRWRQNSMGDEDDEGEHSDRDPYANLMTQKERDWIIKIQLMQIHTNNPYLDDYYYTKWQMEKLVRERAAKADSKGEPKLVLPQLAKVDGRLYKPVQFEGSLGRLTASSVHNPRQIIDVKVKTNTGEEEGRHKEVRRFKQLLIHIEKSYDLLLDIDDVEKRAMALPEDARPPLYHERAQRIHELHERLHLESHEDITFLQLLTVRKGIKLVARTIPFLGQEQALRVVLSILQSLPAILKRDLQDEVMAQLFQQMARVMAGCDLETLVFLTGVLTTPYGEDSNTTDILVATLLSKFGASLVWSVVSRGETIFRTVSPVDLDVAHQNSWSAFIQMLGEAALQTPELAQPFYIFPTVPAYLERMLGSEMYGTLEGRLTSALTPARSPTPTLKMTTKAPAATTTPAAPPDLGSGSPQVVQVAS